MCFGLCLKVFFFTLVYSAFFFPSNFLYNLFFGAKPSTMQVEQFYLNPKTSTFKVEQMWRIETQNKSQILSLPKMGMVQMVVVNVYEQQLQIDIGGDKYACDRSMCVRYIQTPVRMRSIESKQKQKDRAVPFMFMYIL